MLCDSGRIQLKILTSLVQGEIGSLQNKTISLPLTHLAYSCRSFIYTSSVSLAVHSNVLTRVRAVTFVLQVSQTISKVCLGVASLHSARLACGC